MLHQIKHLTMLNTLYTVHGLFKKQEKQIIFVLFK
jgi:hypothetical protein